MRLDLIKKPIAKKKGEELVTGKAFGGKKPESCLLGRRFGRKKC